MSNERHETVGGPLPPELRRSERGEFSAGNTAVLPARWAWTTIPLLLVAMLVLWAGDLRGSYEWPFLVVLLNFLFRTVACLVIAYLAGRSFLALGSPGMLLLGCGALIWGTTSAVAGALMNRAVNLSVTISNLGAWLSALCHLMSVVLSIRAKHGLAERSGWLLKAYGTAAAAVGLITGATLAGWTPIFFLQGQGGTFVRQMVLASAIGMFGLSAMLVRTGNRPAHSSFALWYRLALLLIAAGLFGAMIQSARNDLLDWMARGALWLSGLYMLVAAFAAAREAGAQQISLAVAPKDTRLRYALAVVFVAAAAVVRLAFLHSLGTRVPYMQFYPAVALAALYGGRGPGMLAILLAAMVTKFFWVEPTWQFTVGNPGDWLIIGLFAASSTLIVWITAAMQRAQTRAYAAETQLRLDHERKRTDEAAQQSRERLDGIISSAMDGMISIDSKQRIVLFNPAAEKMFGVKAPDVIGGCIDRFIPQPFPVAHPLHNVDSSETDVSSRRMYPLSAVSGLRACGEEFPIEASISQVEVGGDKLFTVILRDITERKRAEEALRLAQARLQQHAAELETTVSNRTAELRQTVGELEAFSYSLSHDMRAPLRAIRGFTKLVLDEHQQHLGDDGADYLNRVVNAAGRMDRLILDVLTLARMSHQQIEMKTVDLEALVRNVMAERPELQPPQAEITICGPLLPIRGHEASLAQCLTNLLGNAVKFVARGVKPQVRIWTEQVQKPLDGSTEQDVNGADKSVPARLTDSSTRSPVCGGWVRLWIEDNGIGIQAEHQQRIFEMFHRLHGQEAYEGTGIGLAIVRKAVERMGGEAGVESEPSKASRFWVQLPRVASEQSGIP